MTALGTTREFSKACVSSEAHLFPDSLNNVCRYDNSNSFQLKILYIVIVTK